MALSPTASALVSGARNLVGSLGADAVLVLADMPLDWSELRKLLPDVPLLTAVPSTFERELLEEKYPEVRVLEATSSGMSIRERLSLALLEAIRREWLSAGARVLVLCRNFPDPDEEMPQIDTVHLVLLGQHLERLTARELRGLETRVPLATLRAVVELATEIGREGREGHPTGTLFVVGDSRKVQEMSRSMNFNPFRGYPASERDVRDPAVREQIKDLARLEGAILIDKNGIAMAGCIRLLVPDEDFTLSMGLGTRHAAAAAVSKATRAVAVTVSQSSGVVRLFQEGQVVLHIEPGLRPLAWAHGKP
ncbi:MAG: diadenylate cyclase [Planctomycetota bacterium]|nr:diadenylate cyclase [Planctomycetota bacterium]